MVNVGNFNNLIRLGYRCMGLLEIIFSLSKEQENEL